MLRRQAPECWLFSEIVPVKLSSPAVSVGYNNTGCQKKGKMHSRQAQTKSQILHKEDKCTKNKLCRYTLVAKMARIVLCSHEQTMNPRGTSVYGTHSLYAGVITDTCNPRKTDGDLRLHRKQLHFKQVLLAAANA